MLKTNDTLKIVTVENNDIRDDGMCSICEGLQHNHTLTSLSVRNCGFSVKGIVTYITKMYSNYGKVCT